MEAGPNRQGFVCIKRKDRRVKDNNSLSCLSGYTGSPCCKYSRHDLSICYSPHYTICNGSVIDFLSKIMKVLNAYILYWRGIVKLSLSISAFAYSSCSESIRFIPPNYPAWRATNAFPNRLLDTQRFARALKNVIASSNRSLLPATLILCHN